MALIWICYETEKPNLFNNTGCAICSDPIFQFSTPALKLYFTVSKFLITEYIMKLCLNIHGKVISVPNYLENNPDPEPDSLPTSRSPTLSLRH
jgi:hypothetical protein